MWVFDRINYDQTTFKLLGLLITIKRILWTPKKKTQWKSEHKILVHSIVVCVSLQSLSWNYKSLLTEIALGVGLWHANFLHRSQLTGTRIPIRLIRHSCNHYFLSLLSLTYRQTPPRLHPLCVYIYWAAHHLHTQQTFASAPYILTSFLKKLKN